MLFLDKRAKIKYTAIHYKGPAFDVVRTRPNFRDKNADTYITVDEMLYDLDQIFGEYDPYSKADSELHHPDFYMGASDGNKTFEKFHTRFICTIIPLHLPVWAKDLSFETNNLAPASGVND